MGEFLKRLNSYDFFTSLIPGCLLAWYLAWSYGVTLAIPESKVFSSVSSIFVWYFLGLVINRIGAAMERIFQWIGFIKKPDYEDYLASLKIDGQIRVLSEKKNTYRSMASLCLVAAMTEAVFCTSGHGAYAGWVMVAWIVGTVIFIWSQHTQMNYISQRVKCAVRENS